MDADEAVIREGDWWCNRLDIFNFCRPVRTIIFENANVRSKPDGARRGIRGGDHAHRPTAGAVRVAVGCEAVDARVLDLKT